MKTTLPIAALLGTLLLIPACGTARPRTDGRAVASTAPDAANILPSEPVASSVAAPADFIGLSREGRPLIATTHGHGPLRVYLVGGIHGDEPEGQAALPQVQQIFAAPDAGGQSPGSRITLRLLSDMNPDGSFHGTRTSTSGVDLNRNWPAKNFRPAAERAGVIRGAGPGPLSEPETAAAHADIAAFDPHIILVLHSSPNGPFINFDGEDPAESLAAQFGMAAAGADPTPASAKRWRLVPDMGYPTPGSMGSYFGKDLGLPILTVEYKRTNGRPDGSDAGAALLAGLRSLAGSPTNPAATFSRARPPAAAEPLGN